MMTTIREAFTRNHDDEVGGISAEFVAVLIIVAALIAAIWGSDIVGRVSDCTSHAQDSLFTSGDVAMEC